MRHSSRAFVSVLVISILSAAACAKSSPMQPSSHQAGTLALDPGSGTLFVAEKYNGGVALVDPNATSGNIGFISTGKRPEHVILRGSNVFVSNRFSRTVTQIDVGTHQIVRQLATGAEPMGMEVSTDGSTLYVACAMSGSVQAFQISSGALTWSADVGEEIHTVGVLSKGWVLAPGYKSGQVHVLLTSGVREPDFPFNSDPSRLPTSVEHLLVAGGTDTYLSYSLSATTSLGPVISAYYINPAFFSVLGIVAGVFPNTQQVNGTPPTAAVSTPQAGPRASILDASGNFLLTVNYLTNNVGIASLASQLSVNLVSVGEGPDGIALSGDGTKLFVHNAFDHSISVLAGAASSDLAVINTITNVTPQPLTDAQWRGMVTFHNAANPNITNVQTAGVSCASCHPDGREDGNTWQFAEGIRNTPSLVGRQLQNTAPYHWDGAFAQLSGLNEVVQIRMGGAGLVQSDWDDIMAYLSNEPGPDNPNLALNGVLTPQQVEGRTLFLGQAGCVQCHAGPAFTDNLFHEVGTQFTTIPPDQLALGSGAPAPATPNTPSLLGVFATAPYLHSGADATLEARLADNPTGLHGNTSALTQSQVAALAAYLRTL